MKPEMQGKDLPSVIDLRIEAVPLALAVRAASSRLRSIQGRACLAILREQG